MSYLRLVLQCLKGKVTYPGVQPNENENPRPETEDNLTGDALKYEADIEAMNLILISIPNDIYNSVDACQTTQKIWLRVERLMQGTVLTVVDRETQFDNEFDKFTAEPGESLIVRLARDLTKVSYDDLFDYLQQYEKIFIASRAKKLKKTHDPLALVAQTSSSRSSPAYYVTYPPSMVDYDDEYQGETFQNDLEDPLTSVMMLLTRAIT
ncbi:hypothetical protein Tco_1047050 [Tanacetum coccineum]